MSSWADYVGIPWREGGRDRDGGVDCYGLVRVVLADRGGVALPRFDTVSPADLMRVHDEIDRNAVAWRRVKAGREQAFDVVQINRVFSHDGRYVVRPVHLGVMIDARRFLHAEGDGAAGSVIAELDDCRKSVHAVWRHQTHCSGDELPPDKGAGLGGPFDCRRVLVTPGSTLEEIVRLAGVDDATLQFAEIWVGGTRINREWWPRVRPKAGVNIGLAVVPRGGGGLRIAAMVGVIALAAVATFYGGPLAGAAVMTIGTVAINKFLPVPVTKPPSYEAAKQSSTYALSGGSNQRRPGSPVPVLLGRMRFIPPSGGEYTELQGQRVYLHAIFVLSTGPITDPIIEIGDTPITDYDDVEIQFTRGWHPKQLRDRGNWNPNRGFPTVPNAQPGDKWTADRDGGGFKKKDVIVFNGLHPYTDGAAWDSVGKPAETFPRDVSQEALNVECGFQDDIIRETAAGADKIGLQWTSPSLGQVTTAGKNAAYSIGINVWYAPVESPNSWRIGATNLTMTGGASGPKQTFLGHVFDADGSSASKKYRIRVRRTTPINNTLDNQVWSELRWTAIQTITNKSPVPPWAGVSILTMRIRSSGQLTGQLQDVRVTAQSLAWYWDAGLQKWVWGPTSNPAALVRKIYQMPQWSEPLLDDEIDLPRFARWSESCDANSFAYNAYIDFSVSNLTDFCSDIGVAGFAAMCRRDGKRSVVMDAIAGGDPVRIFVNGVNCWGCVSRDVPGEDLDGVRVSIIDEADDWQPAEQIAYADGKDETNSVLIDDRTFIGLTSKQQAFLLGRMAIAEAVLRREVHDIVTNIQGLSCEVGDIVALASDDLAVGQGRGRIASVILGRDETEILGVTLTDPVEMVEGYSYGISYAVGGGANTAAIVTEPGVRRALRFAQQPAMALAPRPDAVYSFGLVDREFIPLVVRDIVPNDDGDLRLTLVAMPPTLSQLKTDLPEWESYAVLPSQLPAPVVMNVASSAREMLRTAQGDLVTRVIIQLAPVTIDNVLTVVQYRPSKSTEEYTVANASDIGNGQIAIIGLSDGVLYDFRIVYRHQDYFPSPATEIRSHRVIGRTDPPDTVENLHLSIISSTAGRLSWDEPKELDVRFGGTLIIRHAQDENTASWEQSIALITEEISADRLTLTVPLLPGTYMIRVRDSSGNLSLQYAAVSTSAASIDQFDVIPDGLFLESPFFVGSKVNVGVVDNTLKLLTGSFDDVADVDAMPNWDAIGLNVANGGVYYFSAPFDMGAVKRVRIRRRVAQVAELLGDLMSARFGLLSEWPSMSGAVGAPVDCIVLIRVTNDDPQDASVTWGPWVRLDVGEFVCRGIDGMALLYTSAAEYGIAVSELGYIVEERL